MDLRVLTIVAILLSGGCVTQHAPSAAHRYNPDLIDGRSVFGASVAPAAALDLLWTSPAMSTFVEKAIGRSSFGFTRFRRLMANMVGEGYFIDQYDRNATYSAAETFAAHKGNCLAYTNMFVALARLAGLEASYQLVLIRPTWDVESGFLVRNNHINVLLDGVSSPGVSDGQLTVDFNNYAAKPETRRRRISDAYAASMFYNNLSVEKLHRGENLAAFAYLKRAILTESRNIDLWNNLGALYSILGEPLYAQVAFETAMSIDDRNKTAITGVAKSLRQQGKPGEAEVYTQMALKYQDRNPFYHFAVAEEAYRRDSFAEALTAVNTAIALKKNNARFYALRAAAAEELGDVALVRKSKALERKHGGHGPPLLRPISYD